MPSKPYDYCIIGAGIIGLTIAYELSQRHPKARLIIVDKAAGAAQHQSGRNSGVIHAGVYYTPGSLKATLCRKGVPAIIDFCTRHQVAFEQCGKLIVAVDTEEASRLDGLYDRAQKNGIEAKRISAAQMAEIEPNIKGVGAILSPSTGIVDYAGICHKLVELLTAQGATFQFSNTVTGLQETSDQVIIKTEQGHIQAAQLIVCGGLQADRLADMMGLANDFRIIPFRGEYFRLAKKHNAIVNHLIYPVPKPGLPFLGVHLTKMVGGYTTVGPNAVLSLGREDYQRSFFEPVDTWRTVSYAGFWKLMNRFKLAGLSELKRSLSKSAYIKEVHRYCTEISVDDLEPYRTGIRAQAVDPQGNMIDDFLIKKTARSLHVCNAPSPAATSSFAIAAHLFETGRL
ncbi:MAG: L-2-hydroxyglutarate oxidase [Amylibacter sp.]|nr:L-2-hydroxyglutarate oxidase [Amylibacter sp.]